MSARVINGLVYDGSPIPYIPHGKENPGTLFLQLKDGSRFLFNLDKFFPATNGLMKALLALMDECDEKDLKMQSVVDFINEQIAATNDNARKVDKYKSNIVYINKHKGKKKRKRDK